MAIKSPAIEFVNVSKRFPGVRALSNVAFDVTRGEVHALVGENGAGKSTLIKICGGVYKIDEGKILWEDKEVIINNPKHSQELGIGIVYQELALCQNLTVAGSIFLGRELTTKYGVLDWNTMYAKTIHPLEILGATNISPKAYINNLAIVERQIIEIAKVVSTNAKLIIMDEPTSALTMKDTKKLFKVIENLKSKGVTIIYVSHKIEEVFEISDRITILKDGHYIDTKEKKNSSPSEIASLMVGRKFVDMFSEIIEPKDETSLKVENLSCKGYFEDISFNVKKGEVLGIAGLRGSGSNEVLRALFGIEKVNNGKIYLNGKLKTIKSPKEAIKLKIGYLPADRHTESLFLQLNIRENISILIINKLKKLGIVSSMKKNSLVKKFIKELKIRASGLNQLVENLSGGNQQKVAVARWLAAESKILLMDDPTRGIDVGAKVEIHNIINNLSKQGDTIIVTSSELQELIGISNRILVMYKGKIKAIFNHENATEEKIIKYATGAVN